MYLNSIFEWFEYVNLRINLAKVLSSEFASILITRPIGFRSFLSTSSFHSSRGDMKGLPIKASFQGHHYRIKVTFPPLKCIFSHLQTRLAFENLIKIHRISKLSETIPITHVTNTYHSSSFPFCSDFVMIV